MSRQTMKHEFFVVCPRGCAEELAEELREFEVFLVGKDGRPDPAGFGEIQIEKGGLTLWCEPLLALQVHFFSKLASRVLLRLARFQTHEFPKLEKSLRGVDLKSHLGEAAFRLKIEAQKSKLGNEKRILQTAEKAWGARLDEDSGQTVLIRAFEDRFTVSLDLTGEHLHRREIGRELGGPAPIRETLAARLLRFLIKGSPLSQLQQVELIDPMAGSGTLLSEASGIYRPLGRPFAFQSQPWIPKLLKSPVFFTNYRHIPEKTWRSLAARDQAPQALERLKALGKSLPERILTEPGSRDPSEIRWVVANPPYGERLKAVPTKELRDLLLESDPWRVGVILPDRLAQDLRGKWPKGWEIESKSVLNGGLPCQLLRFMKKF